MSRRPPFDHELDAAVARVRGLVMSGVVGTHAPDADDVDRGWRAELQHQLANPACTLLAGGDHPQEFQDGSRRRLPSDLTSQGRGVAVFATARQLARLVYRMLRFGHEYVDIGEAAYEEQYRVRRLAGLKESARSLGFTLQEVASG